jgi:hypothetical protein
MNSAFRVLWRSAMAVVVSGVFFTGYHAEKASAAELCAFQAAYATPGPLPTQITYSAVIASCATNISKKVCVELWESGAGRRYVAVCSSSSTASSRVTSTITRPCVPGKYYYALGYSQTLNGSRGDYAQSGGVLCPFGGCRVASTSADPAQAKNEVVALC